MRKIKNIIVSPTPPSTDSIWLNKGTFKYFNDGEWVSIENKVSVDNPEGEPANITAPIIKLSNTDADMQHNINVCAELGTTRVVSVDVEGVNNGITYDVIGIYHNGTVSLLEGDKCTVFDIDFNTGRVILDSKYDTSKFLSYVDLEIGDSTEVKTLNSEKLRVGQFFTAIDYGFGVGTFTPNVGGHAHIVTAYGDTVYYTITAEGAVIKEMESPDIFLEYANAGGTKSKEEFITELVTLMG